MRYKHVIWDWNGTLLDDVQLCLDIMNNVLINRNKTSLSLEQYKNLFVFPVVNYYESIGFDKDDFISISDEFIGEYECRRLECQIFDGVEAILSRNIENGITQSILSAYKHSTLLEIVEHFDLSRYFVELIGQDDIYAHGKIEQGLQWINRIGIGKKDIIMIGDTYHDYEVAREIGVDCILISHGHNSEIKLNSTGAIVVENFTELSKVLL